MEIHILVSFDLVFDQVKVKWFTRNLSPLKCQKLLSKHLILLKQSRRLTQGIMKASGNLIEDMDTV